jgi:hypothetical protein
LSPTPLTDGTKPLATVPILGSFSVGGYLGVPLLTYYYAALASAALTAGTNTIAAMYNAAADPRRRAIQFSLVVDKDADAVPCASTARTALSGATIRYSTHVAAAAPGSGIPTGVVRFYDDGTPVVGCTAVKLSAARTATVRPSVNDLCWEVRFDRREARSEEA